VTALTNNKRVLITKSIVIIGNRTAKKKNQFLLYHTDNGEVRFNLNLNPIVKEEKQKDEEMEE
jgi:hypothetical protein